MLCGFIVRARDYDAILVWTVMPMRPRGMDSKIQTWDEGKIPHETINSHGTELIIIVWR
jgi:hypothetical protein